MAIAQRQYHDTLARPASRSYRRPAAARTPVEDRNYGPSAAGRARPAARRASTSARAASHIALRPLFRPILMAAGLAATLVVYVSGYAQMTRAGYERVWLQTQQRSLQVEQQLLRSDLLLHHNKEAVQRWAEQHGFARPSAAPLVVHAEVVERP